ncbi:alpha/beta hydrolase [Massilia sp. CF038]|uniref:PHA/PHB synthase family protein n=1 Tax=Massilia sp. CF038 TaxID=1881045 RepID=UPI0009181242|nr:alpha/beta fold hydrolase [Massilia sp. CF038]SHG74227.1 polyhydroxyalkanoate synthase [Massilia sp. CF038]
MPAAVTPERRHNLQKRHDPAVLRPAPADAPDNVDRRLHAIIGKFTQGIAPTSLALAWLDWAMHLALSPGKWQQLLEKACTKDLRWLDYAMRSTLGLRATPCVTPLPQDRRWHSPGWQTWPYNLYQQAFLLNQQWWHKATTGIDGVTRHHEDVLAFAARQLLDMASPINFVATNPDVTAAAVREAGANFVRGALNLLEDVRRRASAEAAPGSERYRPGIEVAATPGRVVYRNHLIELLQYASVTPSVHAEPILIVPAWIMKYYILDLSPHNSLVRYLVAQGHTVFIISWHNPDQNDRDLGMHDYLTDGVLAAIDQVRTVVPDQPMHAVGYCLGGTLLTIAAAAMGCTSSGPLESLTLLAAQTDFSEAGELTLFIDESQVAWLEDLMWQQGFLDNGQMAGAFRLLRSHDLIWSLAVNQYLLGERAPMTDLMAWNADATRMPYRMHSEYLRELFLDNALFCGRYRVDGKPIALSDIRLPIFAVATMTDHVSPWRSVHRIHLMSRCDVQFILTSGGHNAGIVSEPGHRGRHYYSSLHRAGDCYTDPERWLAQADQHEGSWWEAWLAWLADKASSTQVPARAVAPGLGPAPGNYVLER